MNLLRSFKIDALSVKVYADRAAMGKAAAQHVASGIQSAQQQAGWANVIFAAAPSQNEFLAELSTQPIDWTRVRAFHMDEYVGLSSTAPQAFGQFLRDRLFDHVKPAEVHFLDGNATDLASECQRYATMLASKPIDVVCAGIGENGHLAFNDPPVADFDDPVLVKVVALDQTCRQQQVNDGCFPDLASVPTHALTLTIPALMRSREIHCIVPGPTKADAVHVALTGPVSTACPASILRRHPNAMLYLDPAAAAKL